MSGYGKSGGSSIEPVDRDLISLTFLACLALSFVTGAIYHLLHMNSSLLHALIFVRSCSNSINQRAFVCEAFVCDLCEQSGPLF